MPSFRTTLTAVAATFAAVANAKFYNIDPESVPLSTRQTWCSNELNTCPLICQQVEPRTTETNTCDPETLTYGCLCGNNQRPNMSEYTLSLPYFVCTEWGKQCVAACANDACRSDCLQNNPCGATDPKRYNATSTASAKASASKTDDPLAINTDGPGGGSDSDSGSGSGKKGAGVALEAGRTYGLAVVMTGLFAGFALL